MKFLSTTAFTLALSAIGSPVFAQQATDAPAPFATSDAIDADQLNSITGRAEISMAINARNTSEVSGNVVSGNSVTGKISFDSSSFDNLNGLSVLSANTGNNVAINSSLNVNVAIRP